MSEPLPHVAGQRAADQPRAEAGRRIRIIRRASSRISRRFSVRRSPSCMRAKTWIWSRISRLLGRSPGLTSPRQIRRAALSLARIVLRLLPRVHQPGGLPGDLPAKFFASHRVVRRNQAHQCGAGREGIL